MEQQGKKKEWVAPELVVLVRSHPEEAVLAACKGTGGVATPGSSDSACINDIFGFCDTCDTPGSS